MQIVFGPVLSRRFGISLGIDLSPKQKQCNFDCVYCELQAKKPVDFQQSIVSSDDVLRAIQESLKVNSKIDVLTFTANGEPTLYPFLEEVIVGTKQILHAYPHIKTLLLSNGSRFTHCKDSLKHFDIVKFSLDSINLQKFKRVDKPSKTLDLEEIKSGIKDFAIEYQGDLIAEILIVEGINDDLESNRQNADFLRQIPIKRLDLSTIDRPSSHRVNPVSNQKLYEISEVFYGLNVCVVMRKNDTIATIKQNISQEALIDLLKRRPLTLEDCKNLLTLETIQRMEDMHARQEITIKNIAGVKFYCL